MAHSPYTESAVSYVKRNQGCCKLDLAKGLRRNPRYSPNKLYYLVDTQIRLGNIIAFVKGNRYLLYTPEYAREHFKDLLDS